MNKSNIILDSSVVAKWFFPEVESEIALAIKKDFSANKISIAVPLLIYWEISNLLKTATKRLRLNQKGAVRAYGAFLKLNFVVYSSAELMKNTLKNAIEFDISSYDASYIALANLLQIPFYTADRKLMNKVDSKFVFDIKDYRVKGDS